MATIAEVFAAAVGYHQAEQLETAEACYRQILSVDPSHADALHLLGVVAYQRGNSEMAIESITRAIGLNPAEAAFHCNLGNALKAEGKLDQAIQSYERALQLKADYGLAYYNLGTALQDQGRLDEAIACFHRAVEINPNHVTGLMSLGNACQSQGKIDEAAVCFRRVTELKPEFAAAHYNLANALQAQGKLTEAMACYMRAIELQPDHAESHMNLGAALQNQGNFEAAVESYRRALELKPDFAVGYYNLGSALQELGCLEDAITYFHRALELDPNLVEAHSRLGNALQEQGKLDDAIDCYCRALQCNPGYAEAHSNLGNILESLGKHEDAIHCFQQAVQLKPDLAEAHNSLGTALFTDGRLEEAGACYHAALAIRPSYAEANYNLAMLLLQQGDFEHGWSQYEWRQKCHEFKAGAVKGQAWDGREMSGAVLLHMEQGIGDTLQFIRYAPLVNQRVGHVVLRCLNRLVPLLSRCRGIDQFVPPDAKPECDAEAHLMSLPRLFSTNLKTVPNDVPYLFADPELVKQWQARLPAGQFNIGIAWQGDPGFKLDTNRSIPLAEFAPLARLPGVKLTSLQKGFGTEQLDDVRGRFDVLQLPGMDESAGAFMDTAAIMMNLDLVITSDTAIAHLAGGLGVPVWVALSFVPEWRWLLNRTDSPWYPTMRLFRQTAPRNWASAFEQLKLALNDKFADGIHSTRESNG
jgi:tetratricopeptide (TPR) repeat protein